MKNTYRAIIRSTGGYLPEKIVDNHTLAETIDTSHEWIVRRTGIEKRHVAAEHDTTSGLAYKAADIAMKHANLLPDEIDLVVVATSTPDHHFPATAARVQQMLGIASATAFDIQAACAGFVFALQMANNMIMLGQAKKALVIGSEIFTRLLDWQERATSILFGDGAGAVILDSVPYDDDTPSIEPHHTATRGIIDCFTRVEPTGYEHLLARGGIGDLHTNSDMHKHGVYMNGSVIFKAASTLMANAITTLLEKHQIHIDSIDWLIPHQANLRIMHAMAGKLGIPEEKVVVTVTHHANTSAASIPLALDSAVKTNKIKPGDTAIITTLGGGIAWGGALVRF